MYVDDQRSFNMVPQPAVMLTLFNAVKIVWSSISICLPYPINIYIFINYSLYRSKLIGYRHKYFMISECIVDEEYNFSLTYFKKVWPYISPLMDSNCFLLVFSLLSCFGFCKRKCTEPTARLRFSTTLVDTCHLSNYRDKTQHRQQSQGECHLNTRYKLTFTPINAIINHDL